jgi:hypothetical protein
MLRFDEQAYVQSLSDKLVAGITNFALKHSGNPAIKVSVERVAQLRAGGTPSPLVALARFVVSALFLDRLLALLSIGIWQIRSRQGIRSTT